MVRTTTRSTCHARARDGAAEMGCGDVASTASGKTSQTFVLGPNRRRRQRGKKQIRSTSTDEETPLIHLKEKDRLRIRTFMQKVFRDSKLPNRVKDFPKYDAKTLSKGSLLGKGTFSSVYKFREATLCNDDSRNESESTRGRKFDRETSMASLTKPWLPKMRKLWRSLDFRRSTPKYAIKTINKDAQSKELLVWSVAYLAAETRMLSALDHPNIMRFCGWGSDSSHASIIQGTRNEADGIPLLQYGHFMVVERLERILNTQLKEWELKRRKVAGCFEAGKRYPDEAKIMGATSVHHKFNRKRQIDFMNQLYSDRIGVAIQLSNAIAYLHERNILHRDIKPHNIGFDANGNVKLFDFGIAKEIITSEKKTAESCDDVNERLYNLTGLTGTRSYMSPENGLHQPYNAKTDVYSFSMVLWRLMTLRKLPHGRYSNSQLEEKVWMGPDHERPFLSTVSEFKPIPPSCCDLCDINGCDSTIFLLERSIRDLLQQCWSHKVHERPTMKSVHEALRIHLLEISQ